jgi:hypothetical protein
MVVTCYKKQTSCSLVMRCLCHFSTAERQCLSKTDIIIYSYKAVSKKKSLFKVFVVKFLRNPIRFITVYTNGSSHMINYIGTKNNNNNNNKTKKKQCLAD